ncbi:MAG: histidine phosphatase family protein [Lachnospiraceae bacterium]|nr:histidine phosphatase family protein [Lachnospiraceae bacterium]
MKKRCILIRHGKTPGNDERRYIGAKIDEELSLSGKEEVIKRKDQILSIAGVCTLIFSSPMKRAMQTAKILFDDRDIEIIEDLRETDFGSFEGKNYLELKDDEKYQLFIDSNGRSGFPGGERIEDFIKRSAEGFFEAIIKSISDNVVIVCHGGNIMAIMSSLTGKDFYDFQVNNLDGYILEIETDGERVLDLTFDSIDQRISS